MTGKFPVLLRVKGYLRQQFGFELDLTVPRISN